MTATAIPDFNPKNWPDIPAELAARSALVLYLNLGNECFSLIRDEAPEFDVAQITKTLERMKFLYEQAEKEIASYLLYL